MSEVLISSAKNESLRRLNRDQALALLFCWKIRSTVNSVITKRLARYSEYYYKEHLLPHFRREEKYIFPLIEDDNALLREVKDDRKRLTRLFEEEDKSIEILAELEKTLTKHICLEQRILLKKLQTSDTENEPHEASLNPGDEPEEDSWEDKFWKH